MSGTLEMNMGAMWNFDREKEEHSLLELTLSQMNRSSIKKAVYYEPEPDHYQSDLIDFWGKKVYGEIVVNFSPLNFCYCEH